jgi:hypothetical protein
MHTHLLSLLLTVWELDFFGGFRDHRCRSLETNLGMGSVAEWLVDGCSATAEGNGRFAS